MNENQGYNMFYNGGSQLRCPVCKNIVVDKFCPFCSNDMTGEFNLQYAEYIKRQGATQPQYQQPYYGQYNAALGYNQAYSGYQQNPYQQYPIKKKTNTGLIVGLCLLGAALITVAILLLNFLNFSAVGKSSIYKDQYAYKDEPIGGNEYYMPDGISTDEYAMLKNGLSYARVSSIIGGDGLLVNNGTTLKDEPFYTYAWGAEYNENALIYITFTNDVVTDITMEGSLE